MKADHTSIENATAHADTLHHLTRSANLNSILQLENETELCDQARLIWNYHIMHDAQTGLPNLDYLLQKMEAALPLSPQYSLLYLDVANIDAIGEYHGIAGALHTLRAISQKILNCIQPGDVAARIHGGAFLALVSARDPSALARKLKQEICGAIPWKTDTLHLSVAIGIVHNKAFQGNAEEMIRAGYVAAQASLSQPGHNGISQFSADQGKQLERQYQLASRLHSALTSGGLSLCFQAKISATEGKLFGAEALLRWHDEQLGEVSPSEFIPLAERNGLITNITKWVMKQAILELKTWQLAGLDLKMAINLTASDLLSETLLSDIQNALHQSGIPASKLIVELTESSVARNPQLAAQQLQALRALGVSTALDDFGTGFSAFSHLRQLPVDTLKIDQSFVVDIATSADARAIVQSIVTLAKTLKMSIVAEGVETLEQAHLLHELGVDVLQGYFFCRPISSAQFVEYINSWLPYKSQLLLQTTKKYNAQNSTGKVLQT